MAKVGEIIMKIITNIILAFLTIAVFFMTYSYVIINVKHESYVNYCGYTMFEVVTGSMADTINIDDLIIIKIDSSYKVGDIITYENDGEFITHRIVGIDEYTGYITAKGDANNTDDATVSPDQVVGKVVRIIPKLGVWKNVIMTPKVIILLFATLVLFNFAFSYNKKKINEKKGILIKSEHEKRPFRK